MQITGWQIHETPHGQIIEISKIDDEGIAHGHHIEFGALGSWAELLGYTDPTEALDAILYVAEHGEPEPDPWTGENAWTPAYYALQEREQARTAAIIEADIERLHAATDDPRSPQLRAALAAQAHNNDVDQARAETRSRLGLPAPGAAAKAATSPGLQKTATTEDPPDTDPLDGLRAQLAGPLADQVEAARQAFLAELSPLKNQETPNDAQE